MNPELEQRLKELMHAFLEENGKLNLSALRTEDACWYGNILDSLPFMELIEKQMIAKPSSIMDIGTGGGFPLLPLAIALPDTACTGLDSIGKKVEAVKRIAHKLELPNVRLVAERSEILAHHKDHREMYHAVVSRAVAPLATLLELTVPFASPTGVVVLWKSLHIDEELKSSASAQKALKCRLEDSFTYELGGDWGKRQLLIFRKEGPVPNVYPRAIGEPKKLPL
jgi:16S rRNA (guanine527-N7)-methyltransferase